MGRMIYTKIVIDMKTGKTLEREGRWYDGEIAECKGGGSSVNNVAALRRASTKYSMS